MLKTIISPQPDSPSCHLLAWPALMLSNEVCFFSIGGDGPPATGFDPPAAWFGSRPGPGFGPKIRPPAEPRRYTI
jgi:hypothetical protein